MCYLCDFCRPFPHLQDFLFHQLRLQDQEFLLKIQARHLGVEAVVIKPLVHLRVALKDLKEAWVKLMLGVEDEEEEE